MAQMQFADAERLHHAYIVSEPDGEKCLELARELAAALVCSSDGPVPCGVCAACRKVREQIHPDVITIRRDTARDGRKKTEISVDQIRAMAADAYVLPNESPRKVYIVDEAEKMNFSAQNAALKLLEEPPRGVYFLLCTPNPGSLLPTVRSRCAVFSRNSGDQEDPELRKKADEFLRALAKGDALELMSWCSANETMDNRLAPDFFAQLQSRAADLLCGRDREPGLDRESLVMVTELCQKCMKYLRVNVSCKQIFALLAVEAIAGDGKQRKNH